MRFDPAGQACGNLEDNRAVGVPDRPLIRKKNQEAVIHWQPIALGLAAGAAQFGQNMQQQYAYQQQLALSQSMQRPVFPQTTTFRPDGFGGYRGSDGSTVKPDGFGGYKVTEGY